MPTNASYDDVYKARWLKSDDLPDEDLILTIKDVNDEEVGEDREVKFILSFRELEKELILNKTNARTLADRFGKDPSTWIGKRIALYSSEVSFAGKMTLAIRIRMKAPVAAPNATPASAPQPAVTQPPDPSADIPW